jgi:hypothetical protein
MPCIQVRDIFKIYTLYSAEAGTDVNPEDGDRSLKHWFF